MTEDVVKADMSALERARARYGARELLLRYARGRVRHFWVRQSIGTLGCAALWLTNGPAHALWAFGLLLLGELVDCLAARAAVRRLTSGGDLRRAYRLTAATALFQSITVGICVGIAWYGPVTHSAPLFALAFLFAKAINAGLTLPHHRLASQIRLSLYALTLVVLLASEPIYYNHLTADFALNLIGAGMLTFAAAAFLSFVNRGYEKAKASTLEITKQGADLATVNDHLREREKQLNLLSLVASHANDGVVISDAESRVTYVNASYSKITGFSLEELRGKRLRDLLQFEGTNADTVEEMIDLARRGIPHCRELLLRNKSGKAYWVEANRVPVCNDQGEVETVISVDRDVTAAKEHAQILLKAKRATEESARAKAEFLATMSHEIRTPMNGIMGMAELMADTDLTPDQRLYAETIRGSAESLLAIVNDILDLSKLDAKKMSLAPVDFSLEDCLKHTVHLLAPQAESKRIGLVLTLAANMPPQVYGDDVRLRQILINLIGNAIKFTEEGEVHVTISVQPKGADYRVSIAVEDTGIGIAPDKLTHVFDRFSQAESSTTRRFGGTGLGLTISKMLADAMGGDIEVRSELGKGSCFTLTLVLARSADRAATPPPEQDDADVIAQIHGMRVLVAEDNRVNRILIDKYLTGAEIDLAFAENGQEAIELSESFVPDVIFMDMSMPVMGGVEATRRIRARDGPQPVIVALTANAFASDRAECLAAGMDGFLSKPVRRRDILAYLAQQIDGAAASRADRA